MRLTSLLFIVLCLSSSPAWAEPISCAVVPPICTGPVTPAEAQAFYDGVVEALAGRRDICQLERANLKVLTDEADLALAMSPSSARSACVSIGQQAAAEEVLSLGISKLNNDYLVSLKRISVANGTTLSVHAGRTRISQTLGHLGTSLAIEAFGPKEAIADAGVDETSELIEISQLRRQCLAVRANELFPSLWERTEKIVENLQRGEDIEPAEYYLTLIHLSARASNPPEGMEFVPGGWVTFPSPAGPRRLWVEPFFIDRCKTSVAEYDRFLAGQPGKAATAKLRPIVMNNPEFWVPDLPVCGITWYAVEVYARSRGRRLPTVLEWLRAAELNSPPAGNLSAGGDGCVTLAPSLACDDDRGASGVLNMGGNVREWTSSWQAKDAYKTGDPHRPAEPVGGTMKYAAGSGWRTRPDQLSAGMLTPHKPGEAFDNVGFRCAMDFLPQRGIDGQSGE